MSETSEKKLLDLIFPEGYPADWDYNGPIQDYLLKLGSYKVEHLMQEPDRLRQESNTLQEQIQDLAIRNYKTFIETAECSRELFTQFNAIDSKLDKLLEDIPNFEEKCKTFGDKSSGIDNLRKLNSLTLTKSVQLLEILELPQLMNSFINDGLYEDALELASYVRKLHMKHPNVPIFKSIAEDVDKTWLLMLHQLLSQLRQDLTLPKCLQIVGYLRRMEVFSEPELRLKFLQTRNCWLEHCLESIPRDDVNYHLTKTIEVTRVNLFNIMTQYRAIFNDDEHSPLIIKSKIQNVNQNIIFYTWIKGKISEFLTTLEDDLKRATSIESILDQCMYFGLSFSKIGCDFRPLLVPIFTKRISSNFKDSVVNSLQRFQTNIEHFTLIDRSHPSIPWKTNTDDPLQPPDSLLEFYPLAEFLNNTLEALNKLKLCPPLAVINDVVDSLQSAMVSIAKSLLVLYNQEKQAFTVSSKDAFTRLCMSFFDDLVPFIQKCIHVIYPPSQIAAKLGIGVNQLQEDGITFLDKSVILQPIQHLLPSKIEPDSILEFKESLEVKDEVGNDESVGDNEENSEEVEVVPEEIK